MKEEPMLWDDDDGEDWDGAGAVMGTPLPPPKLCRDCVFMHWRITAEYSRCAHPAVAGLVDGSAQMFCSIARDRDCYCGPDAKWFQPKPPTLWQRLLTWWRAQ